MPATSIMDAGPWRDVSAVSLQGERPHQEDRMVVQAMRSGSVGVMCVFDGHGGAQVAEALAAELPGVLDRCGAIDAVLGIKARTPRGRAVKRIKRLIRDAFREVDGGLGSEGRSCGSTAAVAIVTDAAVVLAQVGDSYAAVIDEQDGRVLGHTVTHAVGCNQPEVDRLRRSNVELVVSVGRLPTGAFRANLYAHDPSCAFSLGMTRAIGDHDLSFALPIPDVTLVHRGASSALSLVLASDGFTDGYPSAEPSPIGTASTDHASIASDIMRTLGSAAEAAGAAMARPEWRGDNTTVMIARL